MTEQLYFDDPLTLEFSAQVTEARPLDGDRFGLVLPRTYFYPTSGGQEHDTGFIGEARVLDVYKELDDIVHVSDISLSPGEYPASIDRPRRFRAMQHHTAQHVLSASFLEVAEIDSLSANINGDSPSTIDLEVEQVDPEILLRAETYANGIFFENRAVKSYYITDAESADIPFRKPPKVSGRIRVVEVDGFDYTPCGGTHCPNTGMVGLLKVIKTERVNQKLRIHFVAGYQALDHYRSVQATLQTAAGLLEAGVDRIPEAIRRKSEQLKQAQSEAEMLRSALLDAEASRLRDSAEQVGSLNLVTALFQDRASAELRGLAQILRETPGMAVVLAGYQGGKLSLVTASAADSGLDALELLQKHLIPLGLKGGGDISMAQGGGLMDEKGIGDVFENTRTYVEEIGTAFN